MTAASIPLTDPLECYGPVVTLTAALTDRGAIVALSVLVHDRTAFQILRLPLPVSAAGATLHELEQAAELWLALLDGNSLGVAPAQGRT